jgi:pimeloyl-ACP methyl ester carboxylesterase
MITTLQLTMYSLVMLRWQFRHCHDIQVFLLGSSMGGTIALLLGEKYPNLYNGVLDISGPKSLTSYYNSLSLALQNPALPPMLRIAYEKQIADVEAEFAGAPDEKPKAYERFSPVAHADITIPVLSFAGDLEPNKGGVIVYALAVAEAGRSEYYRYYIVSGGGHTDPPVIDSVLIHFNELVDYPVGW